MKQENTQNETGIHIVSDSTFLPPGEHSLLINYSLYAVLVKSLVKILIFSGIQYKRVEKNL